MSRPIVVLAPPRSFTSVFVAMLGQHPQLYGLPELQIFAAETVAEWWAICGQASFPMSHGLLRAVAELRYGEQTIETVQLATGWLRRRSGAATGFILEELSRMVAPRMVVEKSPSTVYELGFMRRAFAMFPGARFIHLLRHPRGHNESVLKAVRESAEHGPVPQWLLKLAAYNAAPGDLARPGFQLDPQASWLVLHSNIIDFLGGVAPEQQLRVRSEDVLADPRGTLRTIAGWLGIRTDDEALTSTTHPERSPFAGFGPPGARLGNDAYFLQDPVLRPDRGRPRSLNGSLPWRSDRLGYDPEVLELATAFGYS